MPASPSDDHLDLVEAARQLGIPPQRLYVLIRQGRIPARLFSGKYLVERESLGPFAPDDPPRSR